MSNLNDFLAYGDDRHALETVMRLHAVKRWHMIDTTRQQTLAEHSANVAMLALMIARTFPQIFQNSCRIAAFALTHDIPEAFTGDIPTHTKRHLSGLDELEARITPPVFQTEIDKNGMALVKLCDLADGIRFIRLHGVDLTARHARDGLAGQFHSKLADARIELGWDFDSWTAIMKTLSFYAYENS